MMLLASNGLIIDASEIEVSNEVDNARVVKQTIKKLLFSLIILLYIITTACDTHKTTDTKEKDNFGIMVSANTTYSDDIVTVSELDFVPEMTNAIFENGCRRQINSTCV